MLKSKSEMPNAGTADKDKFKMPKTESETKIPKTGKVGKYRELKARSEIPKAKSAMPKA